MTMDGRCQPALLRMPHALPAPVDAVGKRVQRRRPVHRRWEPLPDTGAGSGRGRSGGQGGAPHPGVQRAPPLDGPARVQRGLRQAHEAQGLRQTWLALVPARQRCAWRTAMRSAGGAAARRPTGGHGDVAWGAALCAGAPCDPRRNHRWRSIALLLRIFEELLISIRPWKRSYTCLPAPTPGGWPSSSALAWHAH